MPLFYQQNINPTTKLAVWHIEETEEFFSGTVPLQREISHPHKRLQHLAGRFLLRYLYPDFPYEKIVIADTRKPFLPNEKYHFSISHCDDYAAAIVSKTNRVGVDVELISPRIEKIAPKFLSKEEHLFFNNQYKLNANNTVEEQFVNTNSAILNHQLLTILWSAKEAVFKWWGNGEVDFSERISSKSFPVNQHGSFETNFNNTDLPMSYCIFNKLCLVWVVA